LQSPASRAVFRARAPSTTDTYTLSLHDALPISSALRQRDSSAHWASNTHRAPLRLWWIWMQAVRWWPPVIPAQHGSFPAAKFMCPNVFVTQPNQRKGHQVIIDIHGHYTTAPEPLGAWRQQQLAALDGRQAPEKDGPVITDDQICESLEPNQLRLMD